MATMLTLADYARFICDWSYKDNDMLKRFHNKQGQSAGEGAQPTYAQIRRNHRAKQENYYQRHHQPALSSPRDPPATLECLKTSHYLFQGIIRGGKKAGEGVLIFKNGTTVVGRWREGLIHGRAMLFTPFGGRILGSFSNGKLSGWLLSFYQSQVIRCTLYYQNQIDGERLTFDEKEKMWVASKCSPDGRILSIIHAERGSSAELPSFVQSEELKELLCRYVLNRQKYLQTEAIEEIDITLTASYIGFVDEERRPCGLGCLYGQRELYCGNFFEGVLEHYGRMLFESGDIYHGELMAGAFWGRGTYYSPAKNATSIIFSDQSEQLIEQEFPGYVLIDMVPQIGSESHDKESGIKGEAFKKAVEDMEPYYLKEFSAYKKGKKVSMTSLYGHSEDFNIEVKEEKAQEKQQQGNQRNAGPSSRYSNQSVPKPQKWLNFPDGEQNDLSLTKTLSLDKREVAAKKRLGFEGNVESNKNAGDFQSAQIKENFNEVDSETYQKNVPRKTKLMQEIPFGKLEVRSLGVEHMYNFKQEESPQTKGKEVEMMSKVMQDYERSSNSSAVSDASKRMELILDRTKSNRKKIFY